MASSGSRRLFSLLRVLAALAVVVLFFVSIALFMTIVSDSLDEEVDDDESDDEPAGDTGPDNDSGTADTGPDDDSGTADTSWVAPATGRVASDHRMTGLPDRPF